MVSPAKPDQDQGKIRHDSLQENHIEAIVPERLYTSWAAIIAGLVTALATVWFLSLLGSAIGTSVLDGTDAEALNDGLGTGAIVWMVATGIVAFLVGGLVAGRLCGQDDNQAGVLHGVAMWGSATLIMLVLSYWGISGLVNTGAAIVSNATGAVSSAASQLPNAAQVNLQQVPDPWANRALNTISATVKREVSAAIERDTDSSISQEEARTAMEQLDSQALQEIAWAYWQKDQEAAKDTLAAYTDLNEQQIEELYSSIATKVEQRVNEYREQAAQTMETASSYAQAVLWTTFAASALALIASILGGMWGCHEAVRLHAVTVSRHRVRQVA